MTVYLLLYFAAFGLFLLAAFGIGGKIDLLALGLACCAFAWTLQVGHAVF